MNNFIRNFNEIGKTDILTAGGKGANLGEMTNAGIPVPEGAVLTAQAYDRFVEYNKISSENITENNAAEIREAIRNGKFPVEMSEEILAFYNTLGKNARVAVRSSATAEDLEDASFAGQQETYLNVVGEDELLSKIKDCYASLWGNRAVNYRKNQGYDKQKVSLAVVIQQMTESESAGVLFTKDPSGITEDIVINASYGLGEAVVSGIVSPDEYRCTKDGKIKNVVIGSKKIKIVYSDNGTKSEPVSEKMRSSQVLDSEMIKKLVTEALKIESHYGHPMDIEWAVKSNEIFILQARSITTIGNNEKHIFTDKDFRGLPEVKPTKGKMRESVLFNIEKLPKPYFPLDHDFGDNVGKQKQILVSEIGFDMNEMTPIDENGISSFGIGGFKPNSKITNLPKFLKQMKDEDHNINKADEALKECRQVLLNEKNQEHKTVGDVGAALERMHKLTGDTAYARFRYAIFPQVVENITLEKTLKKENKELSSFDLMEGLSYVTANVNRDMSVIAEKIRNDPMLYDDVMKMSYPRLTEKHPGLKEMFDEFLRKYGCRSDFNCYCFTSKSWNDDPDRFLGTLRTLMRSDNFRIPTKSEGMEKFISLMNKMKNRLGRKEYIKFRKKVKAVRHYHRIREATQYLWESIFAYCRELLKKAAEMLDADYDDLLFLFADELFEVCRTGELTEKYRKIIERRKEKRPLAEAYWNRYIEKSLADNSGNISGVSGSAGKASGKVCIVRSPAEFDKLQQGEILVCTYTDPEWTPLFTLAAAVVVDTGGTLSHAAIVAREYKIPAVLAVGDATKKLKDGDTVIVDGTNGTVRIVK